MAEIRGLSIKQMDKRADRFVTTIEQELRSVAHKTAAGLGEVTTADASPAAASVADLNKIKALWEAIVDGQLLSILAAALFSSSGATADSINRVVGRPISTPIGEDTVVELAMKQARNQLVNIGDDYWSEARDSLTEGLQEGESIPKLSARVQDAVEVTKPRAEVIARTEIMRASNQGSIMTMRASELVTMKSWLATPDLRTRPSHRAADGQIVPLDDPFVIGGQVDEEGNVIVEGVKLDHPGDPLGPPNETIQCRCTMLYEVADVELDDEDEPEPLAADGADTQSGDTLSAGTSFKAGSMPWYIEKGHEGCGGDTPWAVVKQDDDEVEGCHATKEEALDQMAALYASEDKEGEDMADETEDKQCPPGQEPGPDGKCVDIKEAASGRRTRKFADKAKEGDTPEPKCPPGQKPGPDGECVPEDDEGEESASAGQVNASGIATREGEWTGDGRMFADGSLDWPDPETTSIPLQWQKETSHGGFNDVTVNIGWLSALERGENGQIGFEAIIDTDSSDGLEAARFVAKRGQFGVSIVADDPEQAEIEFVYPEECESGIDDGEVSEDTPMGCFMPNAIYHSGRIRALTLVDVPAFADAYIEINDTEGLTASLRAFGAVAEHDTDTSDAEWDAATQEGKLDSPMSLDTARSMYAWIDEAQADGDEVTKEACKFPHHEVNDDGTPGAANLAACSAGIGALNGARDTPDIPTEDFQGVYDHLAKHLTDAGSEAPEAEFETNGVLMAASYSIEIPDLPPAEWYDEPAELPEVGAIKITDEGRFYGLLAPRGVAHRSFGDRKVTVPMGNVDYSRWMNRETIVAGGKRIVAGPITMNCGHASVNANVSSQASRDHYDNSCSVVATVRIGENRDGVWVAGALLPGVTAEQVTKMMACQLSGDWRPHPDKPGKREMCGALMVPVPGFPKANQATASILIDNGQLVAATAPVTWETVDDEPAVLEILVVEASNSNELDLPSWEEIQARKSNSAKIGDLAKQLGIEV
jgi:SPP1 gp7 family putative phage head morphogenesis protein